MNVVNWAYRNRRKGITALIPSNGRRQWRPRVVSSEPVAGASKPLTRSDQPYPFVSLANKEALHGRFHLFMYMRATTLLQMALT